MSMTNDPLADSAVYGDVVTSTPCSFFSAHGASCPLEDPSSETIISSNVSNWEGTFRSNMAGLSKQIAILTNLVHSSDNRMLHATNILKDHISNSTEILETKISDNTKMLEIQISNKISDHVGVPI